MPVEAPIASGGETLWPHRDPLPASYSPKPPYRPTGASPGEVDPLLDELFRGEASADDAHEVGLRGGRQKGVRGGHLRGLRVSHPPRKGAGPPCPRAGPGGGQPTSASPAATSASCPGRVAAAARPKRPGCSRGKTQKSGEGVSPPFPFAPRKTTQASGKERWRVVPGCVVDIRATPRPRASPRLCGPPAAAATARSNAPRHPAPGSGDAGGTPGGGDEGDGG